MWTAQNLDRFLRHISRHEPTAEFVLSGYLNRDAASRDYFESTVARLRGEVPQRRRAAFDEAVSAVRMLRKNRLESTSAFAFFIRGGQRMFLYQVPLAVPTRNTVTLAPYPTLYNLSALRDNYDHFTLIHWQSDATFLSHFELGALTDHIRFRKRLPLAECQQWSDGPWVLAAPADLLATADLPGFPVDERANPQQVRAMAIRFYHDLEEHHSRVVAHELLERKFHGEPVHLGEDVITALKHEPVTTLVLAAPTGPADFHEKAVWLATRRHAQIEIVENSSELTAFGGSACR
jgi:hypothetical protein